MRVRKEQRQHRLRARSGWTLVELLVALMIFSVGALAMVATSANVITLTTGSKNRALAASLAAARFEIMRSQPCASHTSDSTKSSGINQSWQVVKLAKADDVTVKVVFVANRRSQTRIYRSFITC
jgi:type IV pilus modification protein PilV